MKIIKNKLYKLSLNNQLLGVILLLITLPIILFSQQQIVAKVQENDDQIKKSFYLEEKQHFTGEDTIQIEVSNEFVEAKTVQEIDQEVKQQKQIKLKSNIEKEVIIDGFIHREDIPLSESVQRHIWNESKKYGIDYELIMAIIKLESNFKVDAISYNESSYGLMQINKNTTLQWLSKEVGISNPNAFNPTQNTTMGIYYLHYLQQYWIKQGLEGDKLEKATVLSYHLGQAGSKRHIKKYGYSGKYLDKVYEYKKQFEVNN